LKEDIITDLAGCDEDYLTDLIRHTDHIFAM